MKLVGGSVDGLGVRFDDLSVVASFIKVRAPPLPYRLTPHSPPLTPLPIPSFIKGGVALAEDTLKLGDAVLAVNGVPLEGKRADAAMDALALPAYRLTVARRMQARSD